MTDSKQHSLDAELSALGDLVERQPIHLIGISERTDNARELEGNGVIPALWQRYFQEAIHQIIPNKNDPTRIIAAYHDIERDDRGPYNFFIGTSVTSLTHIPEGMVGLIVPGGRFIEVTTARGPLRSIGLDAWQKIWASELIRKHRHFEVDLEVYDLANMDPDNSQFKIYIGGSF